MRPAAAVRARFLGLMADSPTPSPRDLAGENASTVASHFGISVSSPCFGRDRHSLPAMARNSTPTADLEPVDARGCRAVGVVGIARDEKDNDRDDDEAGDPPEGERGSVAASSVRAEHQDDGDDRERAQCHADGGGKQFANRLGQHRPVPSVWSGGVSADEERLTRRTPGGPPLAATPIATGPPAAAMPGAV